MQTLYRKYRPQSFDEVIGQEHVISVLKNDIKNKTHSHSYIFSGTRGVGKTTIARILAKELKVTDKDLHEIDAASNTGVDDIREIKESAYALPFESPYKVYLLDEAHMLSKSAFNALLKILEEPPSHVIFMLATTEPEKIPQTIMSRCQHFSLKEPSISQIKEYIQDIVKKEGKEIDSYAVSTIATMAEGSFRDSLSLLQRVINLSDKLTSELVSEILGTPPAENLKNFLLALEGRDTNQALNIISEMQKQGYDLAFFLDILINRLRTLLLFKVGSSSGMQSLDEQEKEQLKKLKIEKTELISFLQTFLELKNKIKNSAFKQLHFELALIDLLS